MPKKHIKYEVTRQAGARLGWQPGGAAGGNWLSACVMSARLHFYWDTQWKKNGNYLAKTQWLFVSSKQE